MADAVAKKDEKKEAPAPEAVPAAKEQAPRPLRQRSNRRLQKKPSRRGKRNHELHTIISHIQRTQQKGRDRKRNSFTVGNSAGSAPIRT